MKYLHSFLVLISGLKTVAIVNLRINHLNIFKVSQLNITKDSHLWCQPDKTSTCFHVHSYSTAEHSLHQHAVHKEHLGTLCLRALKLSIVYM